jgi:hypothetical protein
MQAMDKRDSDTLWGASEIARAINRTKRQTYRLLEDKHIPARKAGWPAVRGCWPSFTKRRARPCLFTKDKTPASGR